MPNVVDSVEPQYLTKAQAATYTGLCSRMLDYARERGELEAFKIGKRILISRSSLDAYIRRHRLGIKIEASPDHAGEVTA
jgi:excisionase family DNA binding protein